MSARTPLAAALLVCAGCTSLDLGLAPSVLPNLGLAASAAVPARSGSPWLLETRFTYQFLDDKTFADNGFPEAGGWTQLDLGLLRFSAPTDERVWSLRFGLLGFRARGEPNLVEESGDYLGGYVGVGFFRLFGSGLAFGPELTLVAASGADPLVLFPQLTWGVRWTPGGRR